LIFAASCGNPRHWGPEQTEPGTVVALAFMPAGHGSGMGYSFGRGGGPTYTSVTIAERYAVVFKCPHGSFTVEGEKAKAVFGRVTQGHTVLIHYQTEYETTKDGDIPVDLRFLTAEDLP
jgi:hypothetical protein